MVFKKAIVQVYSGNEPFGFDDFVRGTLRLFNYAIDHNIDVKINIAGTQFEPYMIVNNYVYNKTILRQKIYYTEVDQVNIIKDLDAFMASSDDVFVITSNVWIDRNDIYHMSYLGFSSLVRYREELYQLAEAKVRANLIYRSHSDNLMYGYSIIYIHHDQEKYILTTRILASLANQIRRSLDMNKDIMLFSNSIQFRSILSQYIEMNSAAVQKIDDSTIDIGTVASIPSVKDDMVDFIILLQSKKIYKFSDITQESGHTIRFADSIKLKNGQRVHETALDMNMIIGNLEQLTIPLYYNTYTLAHNALHSPSGIAIDSSGILYIADTMSHCIRKLDCSGNLTVYAGTPGVYGYMEGVQGAARFNQPTALAIDQIGNLYVADTMNNAIRIIERHLDASGNPNHGLVGTLVGSGSIVKSSALGSTNMLNTPRGVAVDSYGCVYVSDTGNHRICKVTSGGSLVTLAGCSSLDSPLYYLHGFNNGRGNEASFNLPSGLTVDLRGNIYVADTGNNVIRRVTPLGSVTTVAGSGQRFFRDGKREEACFNHPNGIVVDLQNNLYVADYGNNSIRRITCEGNVMTIVGSPVQLAGFVDGSGDLNPTRTKVPFLHRATFNNPSAITIDPSRNLYIADTLNNSARKIVPTFSTPTKIRPIAMQSLRITHAPGVAYTLGPTLSAPPPPPNTIIYGKQRGCGRN